MHTLTRRHFLRSGGAAVGGLVYGGLVTSLVQAGPAAPAPAALSPERQAMFAALVGAMATVLPEVKADRADAVAGEFAARYRDASSETRTTIDLALDAVEAEMRPGEFAKRSAAGRVGVLRAGLNARASAHGVADHSDPDRAIQVGRALALAAGPFFGETREWSLDLFPAR